MATATISEFYSLIRAVKEQICDDDRASEFDEEAGLCLTIGVDPDGNYDYQLGCNEYHGAAYFYPYWLTASIYRSSNCRQVARTLIEEWREIPSPMDAVS